MSVEHRPKSVEALWTVEFESLNEDNKTNMMGAGIVIFETEKIYGGDNQFYYIGKYEIKNDMINAQVEVKIINYTEESLSIFGNKKEFKLNIKGEHQTPKMELEGVMVGDPSKRIKISCQKRVELD